ncbi:hypothetical protein Sphch_1933 [Sphingobium chlorophenolicum L-1]|uniref:Uncharacterized protein n=1 Tax=Sphingobium chlorophenolicum L-1 TaxID=690566 RepID=F6EUS7_SPHCR|nr:hypothetical protein [Sphingobium chlorophenolicum]AEG49610.1 hypothetical protein Sphch_1933 [Sphingobium chlorophenolicum L-1]
MALITCKECGNDTSSQATGCPRCGAPVGGAVPPISRPEHRKVSIPLGIGIALLPIFFAWFLLGRGYSTTARIIGFGWLALIAVMMAISQPTPEGETATASQIDVDPQRVDKDRAAYMAKQAVPTAMKDPSSAEFGKIWGMGDMADFLEALATSPRVDFPRSEVVGSWAAALRRFPASGEGNVRLLHSLDRSIAEQLVEMAAAAGGATGLLVASPYFGGANAVRSLADRLDVDRVQVHVSTALALAGRHYDFEADPRSEPVVIQHLDEGSTQRPMHAKLIEIICRDAVLMVSGSVNASGPALSKPNNVELAVVRRRTATSAVNPFTGSLPNIPAYEQESGSSTPAVLTATMVGRTLSGVVMASENAGTWSARLDAMGEFRDLGHVEVSTGRRFEVTVAAGDEIAFGSRRAILVLSRGEQRIAGFVTFPDLLELNRRWGANAGAMLRVVGGSTEDEDMAGVIEYFARHPDETTVPWAGGRGTGSATEFTDDRVVALGDLEIRPRSNAANIPTSGWGASSIDRLIAAIRRSITGAGSAAGVTPPSGRDDDPDINNKSDDPPPPPPTRTDRVFEHLCDAYAGRIPSDPQTELHRLAELGLCVLARRPDAERFAEFVSWWCGMAAQQLRCDHDRIDLRRMATLLVLIHGMNVGSPASTRRRIASIVGGVNEAIEEACSAIPPRLMALIEEASAGIAALDAFTARVCAERSSVEEMPRLLAAIKAATDPPPLTVLDREPEMAQLRRRIAAGFASRVPIAGLASNSCPRCNIGLAQAEVERLRSVGLVVAKNCCGTVVVLDRSR